jgi:non-lysosomal glucosylceramidase
VAKAYRDWQLSGDDAFLKRIWPNVRRSVEFCWIKGGWDGDRDGVMEGCQHNTMDVEYYGPNPQMRIWYLCALRASEEMARYLGETDFAATCRELFARGRAWTDSNLYNGEYYEHEVRAPRRMQDVAPSLRLHMGAAKVTEPDYQLANGCLVDQLVGQFMAHVCGLGHLVKPSHVKKTLRSIARYNRKDGFVDHFNCMRSYAMGDESGLLMASYPNGRPANPFPYFTEVMTGFEYTAAIGMLYEGQTSAGLRSIADVRNRYDGVKRSPFNEAECGHHYARAMIAWAAHLAITGFHYSGVEQTMTFTAEAGRWFWSNGSAWGTVTIREQGPDHRVSLEVLSGQIRLKRLMLEGAEPCVFDRVKTIRPGRGLTARVGGKRA